MKQRLLAIAGAVALVAVAVLVRATVLDGGDGSGSGGGGGAPRVACTPDLVAVCAALADAGAIARDPIALDLDGATEPPADLDGWLTWDGAPGVANEDAPGTWQDPVAVAGSPLAVARRAGPAPAPMPNANRAFDTASSRRPRALAHMRSSSSLKLTGLR